MKTGKYIKNEPSLNCISSAMNVGHPSNMSRLMALYGGVMDEKGHISVMPDMELMKKEIFSVSIKDNETRQIIKDVWEKYHVLLEPHGAVGWAGLKHFFGKYPDYKTKLCISLETAHPAKFPEEIIKILGFDPDLPESLKGLEEKEEKYAFLKNEYLAFKKYLLR